VRQNVSWKKLKFQTGVCFTNPTAKLDKAKQLVTQKRPTPILLWESDFAVIGSADFNAWVRELRFQATIGSSQKFQPIRILPTTIMYRIRLFVLCKTGDYPQVNS
jgi:hypothetical protein